MAVRAETASKRKSAPDQSALQLIDSSTFDNVYTTTTTIKNKALRPYSEPFKHSSSEFSRGYVDTS